MPKQININDASAWSELDWDEPQQPELLKRTDAKIAMGLPSRIRKETGQARKNALKASTTRFSNLENRKKQAEIGRTVMSTNKSFLKRKEEVRKELMKPMITPFGRFISFNNAQRNIPVDLSKKLKKLPHLYFYEDYGPGPVTYETVYNSPYGSSNKRSDVYNLCKNNNEINAIELSHKSNWWKKMIKIKPNEYFISIEIAKEWTLLGFSRNKK